MRYGHSSLKLLNNKHKKAKSMNVYNIPTTKDAKKVLEFNATIPIYCLQIVLRNRTLDLVFQTFRDIKDLFAGLLIPFKRSLINQGMKVAIPTLGRILWDKFRYYLLWRLGKENILQTFKKPFRLTFCQIILISTKNLMNSNV